MPRLTLINEFRKFANEEKFKLTMLGGELFQTFTTRSLKVFPCVDIV